MNLQLVLLLQYLVCIETLAQVAEHFYYLYVKMQGYDKIESFLH